MCRKIKVLFVAADPFRANARQDLDDEMRAIGYALRQGCAGDTLELVAHFGTGADDLRDALLRHEPRIVHFAGRGDAPGVIYLGDEHGRQAVEREALRGLFGLRDSVRVVVLSGRDTLATVQALSGAVDYAVGINGPVTDEAALAFAQAFYSALAMGRTVLAAFELGLMEMKGKPGSAMPVRRIRPGVNLDDTLVPAPWPGEGGADPGAARGRCGTTPSAIHL